MKRVNNLFQQICSIENLQAADIIARKGKAKQYGVKLHDRNRDENIQKLHEAHANLSLQYIHYSRTKRTGNIQVALLPRQDSSPCRNDLPGEDLCKNIYKRYLLVH